MLNQQTLVGLWLRQALASERVHYRLGSRLSRLSGLLTIGVVVSAAVVGSSLFALLNQAAGSTWKFALAVTSLMAAALSAAQRTLGLSERAERHRVAGSEWQRVVNKAAMISTTAQHGEALHLNTLVQELGETIEAVVAKSPQIPDCWFRHEDLKGIYDELKRHALELTKPCLDSDLMQP